jgi:DNA-binding transcriptional MerR regulator
LPLELTRTEAAKYLGVSPRTLDYWATKQIGPNYRRRGRKCFYRQSDLDTWSDQHQLHRMLHNQTASSTKTTKMPTNTNDGGQSR